MRTWQQIMRRLLSLVLVALGVTIITFALMGLVPGDPAEIIAAHGKESEPSAEEIAAVRKRLGLDLPMHLRYIRWLGHIVSGDLGRSLRTGEPVWQEIASRLPATMELALGGMAVALLIALPIGIASAIKRGSWLDFSGRILALLGASVPAFWLGAVFIWVFAVQLGWLPSMGRGGLSHFVLPCCALGIGASALLMRLIRANLLETLDQEFIRTARAKGLPNRAIILGHALKPSLLPVVTVLGLQFGQLLGGAVIVETVFAWPGLGMLIVESILGRDFLVVQGFALLMGLIIAVANSVVDMVYLWLDPRIHYHT